MTAVANAYSAFGPGYRESEHGGQGRMTAAISAAYDQMSTP